MKCKDCKYLARVHISIPASVGVKAEIVKYLNVDSMINKQPIQDIYAAYCPRVETIVDVSTERQCEYFFSVPED